MFNLLAVGLLIWISATFVALWIHGARTGVAPLVGPLLGIRQDIHPIGYLVAMSALAIPMLLCLALLFWGFSIAFPREGIPLPPAQGYVEAGAVTRGGATNAYFPPALTRITYQCAHVPKPVPILSEHSIDWYSGTLKAAGEPSLIAGLDRVGPHANVYRFTWLRTFDAPMTVRIREASDGQLHMVAKRLSGMGGYEPGETDAQVERPLTAEEHQKFVRAFIAAQRLKMRAVSCHRGYDGARWLMEAVDDGRYRYVDRWSPEDGPIRDLGLTMLGFTGWKLDPIY